MYITIHNTTCKSTYDKIDNDDVCNYVINLTQKNIQLQNKYMLKEYTALNHRKNISHIDIKVLHAM